jgi:molybdopterin-binding protein
MKLGAQNQLTGKVTAIKRGNVMAQIKVHVECACTLGSVLTVDSLEQMGLKEGDEIMLVIKAVNVLPVKPD